MGSWLAKDLMYFTFTKHFVPGNVSRSQFAKSYIKVGAGAEKLQ